MINFKKIFSKCYQTVRLFALFVRYVYAKFRQFNVRLKGNKKTILFTLEDDRLFRDNDDSGRNAYMALDNFSEAGYDVYLYKKFNFSAYKKLGKYGRPICLIRNLKIVDKLPLSTDDMIYAFDTFVKEAVTRAWKKKVYVNIAKPADYFMGDMVWMPYFTHPLVHQFKKNNTLEPFRETKRNIRVFFGGNTSKQHYDNPNLRIYFNHMTRREGIRAILSLGESVELYSDAQCFYDRISTLEYIKKCILLQTDHTFPIKTQNWLKIVSKSDFFLCLPGSDMPMCHNAFESMAVGTIPIISYADWFFPALEHGKNAIVFSGKDDLLVKLNEVLNMAKDDIDKMRKNVERYYDDYLTAKQFVNKFEQMNGNLSTIMLHPRINCTPVEAEEASKIYDLIQKNSKCYV